MDESNYYSVVRDLKGIEYERRLRFQMDLIYKGIDFRGKSVIDIGGGVGLHSFYALSQGAKSSIIIEPEGDGGHTSMIESYEKFRAKYGDANIRLVQETFQDYSIDGARFDLVIIHDAINHFNEEACISLTTSSSSREVYNVIFQNLKELLNNGGKLIMSDCSSQNMYPRLGVSNPFDPEIEWHKHQPPGIWSGMLKEHNVLQDKLRWSSPSRLGKIGQALFGNRIAAWFFTSHFIATYSKH